jgi:hypothetical protein
LAKALAAGYGTDCATLTDGAALRQQSIDPVPQALLPRGDETQPQPDDAAVRDYLAGTVRPEALAVSLMGQYGFSHDQALAHVKRFLRDLLTARNGVPV